MENVKLLKLVTGEDIVGRIIEISEDTYTVDKVRQIMLTPDGRVAIIPYHLLCERETFELKTIHIVVESEPREELKNAWAEQTGTISVPEKSLVLPNV